MSRENVEVVKAAFETWNSGDMTAFRELLDLDIVMYHLEGWPEPGPSVGRDAVMEEFQRLRDAWDADELIFVSDIVDVVDRVLARIIWRVAGHGPAAEMEMTLIWTLRKGRIRGIEYFWDHAEALEALEALGLRE